MNPETENKDVNWERSLLADLAGDALKERRARRRWGIFFKLLTFAYIGLVLALVFDGDLARKKAESGPHTALVDIEGVIAPGQDASADNIVEGLRDAFEDEDTKAVVVRINSPGGSPVQASYVYREIRRLRAKHDIPVYAVVSDMCASGGYYIAAAADRIYVNESSIVGSIGVLMNGFGFVDAMDELGVERRLLTAGEHKGILDPFSPLSDFDRSYLQGVLDELHEEFIRVVREGRGERLVAERPELFSGLFWSGSRAVELGLADGIGSAGSVARDVVEVEKIVDFTAKEDALDRLAKRFGASFGGALLEGAGLGGFPRVR